MLAYDKLTKRELVYPESSASDGEGGQVEDITKVPLPISRNPLEPLRKESVVIHFLGAGMLGLGCELFC